MRDSVVLRREASLSFEDSKWRNKNSTHFWGLTRRHTQNPKLLQKL